MGRSGRRTTQRNAKKRKAFDSLRMAKCPEPDKVPYRKADHAQRVAIRLGKEEGRQLRVYPCGRHYHLTSRA